MSSKSINEFNADVLVVSRKLGHSSSEINLKHYAHLWSRNDEPLAEKMKGNIKLNFSNVLISIEIKTLEWNWFPTKTLPKGKESSRKQ